jgi:chromosome partitioning protein
MRLAVANQKGGVGKTTVAVCLAEALGANGADVTLVDFDPQASATGMVLGDHTAASIADVMLGAVTGLDEVLVKPPNWHFRFVPSALELAKREQWQGPGSESLLKKAFRDYDGELLILDCPPSLGLLTLNAFVAADAVIAVSEASYVSLRGLSDLRETIAICAENYQPSLALAAVVVSRYRHTREHVDQLEALRAVFGSTVLGPPIPELVAFTEMASRGVPLRSLEMKGSLRRAIGVIDAIAEQVAERIERHEPSRPQASL